MKCRLMMNLVAGAGLIAGPLAVAASDFGGGWKQDRDTGTLYYSLAPSAERHGSGSGAPHSGSHNSFGGGWFQDRHTGTLSYSHEHAGAPGSVASNDHSGAGMKDTAVD